MVKSRRQDVTSPIAAITAPVLSSRDKVAKQILFNNKGQRLSGSPRLTMHKQCIPVVAIFCGCPRRQLHYIDLYGNAKRQFSNFILNIAKLCQFTDSIYGRVVEPRYYTRDCLMASAKISVFTRQLVSTTQLKGL